MSTPQVDMADYDQFGCLHDMLISQALQTPHRVAVVDCDGTKVTYEELNRMSDLLANKLRRLGLGRNKVGGILMERSLEYTVSVIAILKAGGAYLPVEVSWPASLLEAVLKDTVPSVICTKDTYQARVEDKQIPVVRLSGNWQKELTAEQGAAPLLPAVQTSLDDTAYIVYSSGTTGTPKGIVCPHRGAVFSYTWRHRAYPYDEDEREACNVFFVWEMLRPLMKGIPMYVIPDDVIYDPPKLVDFIYQNKITRILFTPSLLQAVLEFNGINLQETLKTLRIIIYCGEVVTTALRDKVASSLPWIKQLNLYSISECHDVSNADLSEMQISRDRQFCPVGKLMPGVQVVIMDEQQNVKSVGESGEIYIGGPGLAIEYLNRPDLNKVRFISRPSEVSASVGERLYRTGDWGYVLSDGSLEVCGRCDTMVKIRGYTIELEIFHIANPTDSKLHSHIQSYVKNMNHGNYYSKVMGISNVREKAVKIKLLELPGVMSTCLQVYGSEGEEKTLVAFIVPEEETSISNNYLRSQLKKKIPFYMIPSRFIILKGIPIVEATGKLDTKSLAALYGEVKQQKGALEVTKVVKGQEQPISAVEKTIAHIWSDLLNCFTLDVDESFFDVGGHSLLAAALTSKLNQQFQLTLSTSNIFRHPTIRLQAELVNDSTFVAPSNKPDYDAESNNYPLKFDGLDARMRSFWQTIYLNPSKFSKGNILLTGATGYVGCFLLHQLLNFTEATVYCLLRESPTESPLERLAQAREKFGLRRFLPPNRIIPLKGDVGLTSLGLGQDVYSALCLEVDAVIHAAAQVNFILPFSSLHSSNVFGTHNILKFCLDGKIKPLHYISTDAVFPEGLRDVDESVDPSVFQDQLQTGYGQTKWLAERMVRAAVDKGFPATVFRLGNVGGSRLVAGWNPSDFNFFMFRGVIKTGFAPDIDWKIELTPSDFVSEVIINLVVNLQECVGKTFHIINTSTFHCKDLWKLLNTLGYSVNTVSFSRWKGLLQEAGRTDSQLAQLSHLLDNFVTSEDYFARMSTFRNDNLSKVLNRMNLKYPVLTDQLFETYIKGLSSVNIISKSKTNSGHVKALGCLSGKVVLVTGASSGIGEGIARSVARAGATVVLAARRLDRLKDIAQDLLSSGAKAVPVQLDVCDSQQVYSRVQEVEATVGPIDVLVNNAGVMYYQLFKSCDLPRWQHMLDVNVKGTLNCLAAVVKGMVARGSGHIVNISSDAARKPFAGLAVYSGTKHFVHCLSGAMRAELASSGIKVTDIQPGDVTSEIHNFVPDPEAEATYDWSTKVPILQPSDVGEAVIYVLSQPHYCAINEILLEPQLLPLN